jgi:CII-binding regulator of phage lambda lysogenization HflD
MTREEEVSLKEYFEMRFNSLEKRFDSINASLEQLSRQSGTFINRAEHDVVVNRLNLLENKISNFEGRLYVIGVVAFLFSTGVTIALHFAK